MNLDLDLLSEYELSPNDISLIAKINPLVVRDILDYSFNKTAQHFLDNDRLIELPSDRAVLLGETTIGHLLTLIEENKEKGTVTFTVPGFIFKKLDDTQYYDILNKIGEENIIPVQPTATAIAPKVDVEYKKIDEVNNLIFQFLLSVDKKLELNNRIDLWKEFISKVSSYSIPEELKSELSNVQKEINKVLEEHSANPGIELQEIISKYELLAWFDAAKESLKTYREQLSSELDTLTTKTQQTSSKDHFGAFLKHLYIIKEDMVNEVNHIISKYKSGENVLETLVIGNKKLELVKDFTSQKYYLKLDENGKVQISPDINLDKLQINLAKKTKEYKLGPTIRLLDQNVWTKYDKFVNDALNRAFKDKSITQTYTLTIGGHSFSIRFDKVGDNYMVYLFSLDPSIDVPNNIIFQKLLEPKQNLTDIDFYKESNSHYNIILNILRTLESTKPEDPKVTLKNIENQLSKYGIQNINFSRLSFYTESSKTNEVMQALGVCYAGDIRNILLELFPQYNTEKLLKNILRYFDNTQFIKNWLSNNEDSLLLIENRILKCQKDQDIIDFIKATVDTIVHNIGESYLQSITLEHGIKSSSYKWFRRWALPVDIAPGGEPALELPNPEESGVIPYYTTREPSTEDTLTSIIKKQEREEREKAESGKEIENINHVLGPIYMYIKNKNMGNKTNTVLLSYILQVISNKLRRRGYEFNIESLPGLIHFPEDANIKYLSDYIKKKLKIDVAPHSDALQNSIKNLYMEFINEIPDENLKDVLSE